ncbi:MAG: BLUF domain-containing protein [Oceanicaulis sp.]
MFRVAYRSNLSAGVGEAEIAAIVAKAAEDNAAFGLCGAWLMNKRRCLGVLEGEPRKVREVVERIWTDRRHSDFVVLTMEISEEGRFSDWPFRFIRPGDLASDEALAAHSGVYWLGKLAGGLPKFFDEDAPDQWPEPGRRKH